MPAQFKRRSFQHSNSWILHEKARIPRISTALCIQSPCVCHSFIYLTSFFSLPTLSPILNSDVAKGQHRLRGRRPIHERIHSTTVLQLWPETHTEPMSTPRS